MIKIFATFLAKRPLVGNCLTYGTLYFGAELSQQFVKYKIASKPTQDLDKPTLARYAIMGTFIYSPILFGWYKWLDSRFVGTAPKIIVRKLILDQFLLTPPLLVVFFAGMAAMEGAPLLKECKEKFVSTFEKSCLFWLPVQTVNFIFVPPKYRVTYMGAAALIWVNILCWVKRQKTEPEKEKALSS